VDCWAALHVDSWAARRVVAAAGDDGAAECAWGPAVHAEEPGATMPRDDVAGGALPLLNFLYKSKSLAPGDRSVALALSLVIARNLLAFPVKL
jgi:hypothetical protein